MTDYLRTERILLFALGLLLFLSIFWAAWEEARWQTFSREHNCKQVAEVAIKDMRGYVCDDGVTYWR